jgi:type I restriction enzyme S subunit
MSPRNAIDPSTTSEHARYGAYTDAGVDWLDEIPAHWEVVPFRYYCDIPKGQVDPESEEHQDRTLISPNHVEQDTGKIRDLETADEQGASSGKYLVEPGDLIYSKIRPELNKVCISKGHWLCSADMYPIKIRKGYDARFLKYLMLSQQFVRLMVNDSMRVAMPKVNRDTLGAARILLPPLPEQRAIAAYLNRETERIDALLDTKERLIDLLEEKRTALISRAVTKGLDDDVEMQDSGVEWLGEIPAHWDTVKLKFLSPRQTVGVVQNPSSYFDPAGTVPFILGNNISIQGIDVEEAPRITEESNHELEGTMLRSGDLVVVRVGDPGITAVIPPELDRSNCGSVLIIRQGEDFNSTWLAHVMNSKVGEAQIDIVEYGAAQRQFNLGHAVNFQFPVPPKDEQGEIARHLDSKAEHIDTLVDKVRDAIDRLKEYRTALISAAVTGQIDVRGEAEGLDNLQ